MINSQQSKLIVVCLLLVILGAILLKDQAGFVPISALVNGREPGDGEASEVDEAEPGVVTNAPPRYLTELKNWHQLFSQQEHRRDPFRSTIDSSPKARLPKDGRAATPGLQLQAISRNDRRALVVISGQVLGVGDVIHGYEVAHIDRDWVLLKGMEGPERKLQLDFRNKLTEGAEAPAPGQPASSEDPPDSPPAK